MINFQEVQQAAQSKMPFAVLWIGPGNAVAIRRVKLAKLIEGLQTPAVEAWEPLPSNRNNGLLLIATPTRRYKLFGQSSAFTQRCIQANDKAAQAKPEPTERGAIIAHLKQLDRIIAQYDPDHWSGSYKWTGTEQLRADLETKLAKLAKFEQFEAI